MTVHDTSWDAAPPPATPASAPQPPAGGRLTSYSIPPHPPRVPWTFLPDEGESEPAKSSGTNPPETLGSSPPAARSFSPARLNAVGAGLPRIRGQAEPVAGAAGG